MITDAELLNELEVEIERLMRLRHELSGHSSSYEENSRLGYVDAGIELSQQALRGTLQFLKPTSDRPAIPNDPEVSCALSPVWWLS